jgi:antirestriction protein ArdC
MGQEDSMRAAKTKARHPPTPNQHPDWTELLVQAVNTPGVIADAYSRFWNYSIGNQLLALFQCMQRGIEPGPIHTFVGWRDLDRHVKKGEKAITLCMPVTVRCSRDSAAHHRDAEQMLPVAVRAEDAQQSGRMLTRTCFVYRSHWFVLSQTDGAPYVASEMPQWSESRALAALGVQRTAFRHLDGNVQGYATAARQVAVSPVAFMPARTLMHELAHIVLGHTEELQRMEDDDSATPRDLREVEAEGVALICCSSLGFGGEEFSRGYVQHWLKGQSIPARAAQKIFKAADQILRAGRAEDEPNVPRCSSPA